MYLKDQTGTVIVEDREVLETSDELGENATETELPKSSHGICPICQKEFPMSILPYHGSVCAESSFTVSMSDMEQPGPSSLSEAPSSPEVDLWKTVEDQKETVRLFLEQLRRQGQSQPSLLLMLDSRDNDEERDRSLISFYKESHQKSRWAAPFRCHIQGDAAIGSGVTRHILSSAITKLKHGFKLNFGNAAETTMFEGERDHLVPSTSAVLVESELFIMAGRMMGHSIINNGPTMSGLSLAVVNALTGGTKETATSNLSLQDCPDLDHRETIRLLLKEEWTEEETLRVTNLCLDWSYTVPTKETNRLLLFQQLLSHAVLGRVHAQIKQLRKGLKETGIWHLITCRPDVVPLLFPRESDVELTSQMVRQWIQWPQSRQNDSEDSDEDMQRR
ncbi:uncharacterized protein LOC143475488 [Brachyhypopomus gauderio]|uniref:uncharacterized protein LOC143475488 n=1 Tax=Brachyhypopomus gauderio TaxID=698409 RepID=UPI004041491A